jgi:hypothetical protein
MPSLGAPPAPPAPPRLRNTVLDQQCISVLARQQGHSEQSSTEIRA